MFGGGYGGYGGYGGGAYGGYGGGRIIQDIEQERIGFGPQGYGLYEQETEISRNPYTGSTTVTRENEFIPMGGYGGYGGGGYGGYGGYGGRFY